MPTLDDIAPQLAADVVVRPADEPGRNVVKNPRKQTYLKFGEQESFLLAHLDGKSSYRHITEAFRNQFQEPLTCDDIKDFIKMVKKEGLLARSRDLEEEDTEEEAGTVGPTNFREFVRYCIAQARKQSPFYFRVALFDPDRTLNWLEPKTRWLFSRWLAIASAIGFVMALVLTWANRDDLYTQFSSQFGWRTLVIAWLTTIAITICHEFGHGLACKRFDGEVREMGALWIFFTPCLFCNVSDAWLFASRWRRLLVSMAGTYVDLLIWIVSVFVWRVTAQHTALNYMAWIVVTTCGLRVLFNVNPLMRLDGYYALSDLLGIPNLRRLARQRWMEYVRWILWGAERPAAVTNGRALLIYGVTSWFFTVGLLNLLFLKVTTILQSALGLAGFIAGATVFAGLSKRYFKGSLGGEFKEMIQTRQKRLLMWGAAAFGLLILPIHDRAGGTFHVRPVVRWEVRAPVDGFLREVTVDEGDSIEAGAVLARFEVPELNSLLSQKEAEIHEVEALLRRLEAGPRREEVAQQRERVSRAIAWRDLAEQDLRRSRISLNEELASLELKISQADSELQYQKTMFQQAQQLYERGGLAGQQLLSEKKRLQIAEAELFQIQATKRAREAEGVMSHEAELARRQKDLADTEAALFLLEAGSRSEDIEAEQARLVRLQEEQKHLLEKREKQVIIAPASGTVTTPRLREKIGQFLPKGAEVCFIEDLDKLEAEVAVAEQDARVLRPGQPVSLKPRSLPFQRLSGVVDRIAPSAITNALTSQRTVTVYCRVDNDETNLLTGMTGFGRVYHRWRPLGWIGATRALQFFRTEFWL
ncbi:MAG: HlyD family efflux transporter periplasmic adaptor subunit [Planctomycetia bacterium]|nr:HlyD family efflux transporter periplasmic adaptor subunit [Planctomycetia bacterium]